MIRRPPRSTQSRSSAASDVYKRQKLHDRRIPNGQVGVGVSPVKFKLYATPPLLEAAMTVLQTVDYHGPHLYRPQNGKGCGSCMGVLLMSRLVAAADCVRTDVISWSQYRAASRVRGRHFDVGRRLLADGRRRPPTHHAHWTDVCRRLLRRSDPRQPRLSRRPPGDHDRQRLAQVRARWLL